MTRAVETQLPRIKAYIAAISFLSKLLFSLLLGHALSNEHCNFRKTILIVSEEISMIKYADKWNIVSLVKTSSYQTLLMTYFVANHRNIFRFFGVEY